MSQQDPQQQPESPADQAPAETQPEAPEQVDSSEQSEPLEPSEQAEVSSDLTDESLAEAPGQGSAGDSESQPAEGAEPDADSAEESDAADQGAGEELQEDLLPDGLPVRRVIEALLFATDSPLPAAKIAQVLEQGTSRHVRGHIKVLNARYERTGSAFRIEEVAGGYQMLTLPAFQPWLAKLLRARAESRLSPTQMETLAIIAYKQPVLRADVEVIRGVAAGDVINRLRELGLVKIVGRAEDVGRPLLYGTTKKFLRVFGLGSLDDLPRVEDLRAPQAPAAPAPAAAPTASSPAQELPAAPPSESPLPSQAAQPQDEESPPEAPAESAEPPVSSENADKSE